MAKTIAIILTSLVASAVAIVPPACTTTYTVPPGPICSCPTKTLHTATSLTNCHGCTAIATATAARKVPVECLIVCTQTNPLPTNTGTTTVVKCSGSPIPHIP